MSLTVNDRLAIHELLALYGHIIDDRQFSRFDEIFTSDATFDLRGYGGQVYSGLDAIVTMMTDSQEHPLAHHASNIVVSFENNEVCAISKGLGVGFRGKVGSVVYRDKLARTEGAWRINERKVELRTVDNIPEIS